jgi:hypothetical protein
MRPVSGGNTEIRNLWQIGLASSSRSRLVALQPARDVRRLNATHPHLEPLAPREAA